VELKCDLNHTDNSRVVLLAGGQTTKNGQIADVEVYSPQGTCQLQVMKSILDSMFLQR